MTTIYVVSTGDYSEYHIVGICSTKEKAEILQTATNADGIEEWPLDELADFAAQGYRGWAVYMQKCGNVLKCYEHPLEDENSVRKYLLREGEVIVRFYCNAKSQDHAVKIANEKRAQMIANNEWSE